LKRLWPLVAVSVKAAEGCLKRLWLLGAVSVKGAEGYLKRLRQAKSARQKNQRLRRLNTANASEAVAKPNVLGSGTLLMATVSVAVPAE